MTLSLSWPHISVVSIIDIVLVAILIYEFLVLVRGTRAAPMLIGVAVLSAAFYFARLGELRTLNWLLSTLLPYVVFALIVVFQSEIRQGLANLGSRVSRMRSSTSAADVYDDVVLAANLFSQDQTGALIVIEREIGLRTYIESGVALDARLSYDLLATVFRPSAPLHDGAVIVQRDRIAAAACFLPLSMNPVLSTQLGTRHRAAIGVTEETDAVAVVVSEETGAISLAVAGNIERDLTVERLRERLSSLL
ncbi:MAG TPA: diadenylate cyclase CdaA, partial [Terriglobales bacterium]